MDVFLANAGDDIWCLANFDTKMTECEEVFKDDKVYGIFRKIRHFYFLKELHAFS